MSHSHHHHSHTGDHHHHHSHGHHHVSNKKVLFISFMLIFIYMVVEVVGGILTNSLALLSDAGHMLSDAAALGLSLLAFKIGERNASAEKTYGYRRFEILAAFINGLTLILISLYIVWEAYHRFIQPPEVSVNMMVIAVIGLVVNIVVAWILLKGDTSENLNVRSAFLHVLGDMLGSFGAIIAGILIWLFNWNIADPIASVIVAVLVLISGFRVTRDSVHVLMEGKPSHIHLDEVKKAIQQFPGITDIHDLHIWSITSDFPSLSCHLVVETSIDRDHLLHQVSDLLIEKYHIKHSTIQIEGTDSRIKDKEENCMERMSKKSL